MLSKKSKKIIRARKSLDDKENTFSANLHPLLKRIYLNRGIQHESEIDTSLKNLLPYHDLLNIDQAAALLGKAIQENKRMLIVGDFDTDGATSTALAIKTLKTLGAKYVDYLIPNRFEHGYGLTPEIVDIAAQKNPDILITVDNGISSHEGIKKAREYGMEILVTDHHLAPEKLPENCIIVNPNQPHDLFKSKNMAGVGVIFYVMCAVKKYLNSEIPMVPFLDYVALGTVADVVPLDKNNRILVHQGLKRLRQGQGSPGIYALLQTAGRQASRLSPTDLGFLIAPRLNAAGRLEDMSLGVTCLLSENKEEAKILAMQLDQLNKERREIQSDMLIQAEKLLEHIPEGLCLYHPDFHQGVIGIIAGKLKDRYHRPTVIFSKSNADELKGSARSIPSIHLRDLLALMDTRHPDLIKKFGGHAMAAGLTIAENQFEKFSTIFNETINQQLDEESLKNILYTDGELHTQEFTIEIAELLRDHSPWGQGFPAPLFEGNFEILQQRLLQEKHLKLVVKPVGENIAIDAIYFHHPSLLEEKNIKLAYRLDINEYQEMKKIQLLIEYIDDTKI